MKKIINEIKESIVFLGFIDNGKDHITGTGFLVQLNGVYHIVTAKHVVEKNYQNLFVFLNSSQFNKPIAKALSTIYKNGFHWIVHKNPKIDIAILPFIFNQGDKVKFIPDSLILKNLNEIYELLNIFYLSFQPGLNSFEQDGNINPIIRKGVISRMNNDNTFFIDGFAFPGNSGSPVFLFPTLTNNNDNSSMISNPVKIQLVGIMGAYIPYRDVAISQQTGRPKVIFEENTGLSLVWSTKFLHEIIESDDFKNQLIVIGKNSSQNSTVLNNLSKTKSEN